LLVFFGRLSHAGGDIFGESDVFCFPVRGVRPINCNDVKGLALWQGDTHMHHVAKEKFGDFQTV
jgi:hypothetical protein